MTTPYLLLDHSKRSLAGALGRNGTHPQSRGLTRTVQGPPNRNPAQALLLAALGSFNVSLSLLILTLHWPAFLQLGLVALWGLWLVSLVPWLRGSQASQLGTGKRP